MLNKSMQDALLKAGVKPSQTLIDEAKAALSAAVAREHHKRVQGLPTGDIVLSKEETRRLLRAEALAFQSQLIKQAKADCIIECPYETSPDYSVSGEDWRYNK